MRGLSERALRLLRGYAWPGNVRELKNAIEGAVAVARGVVKMGPQRIDEPESGEFVEHGIPVGMGFAVGVNEVAETRFGGQESMGIQAFLTAVHFLQMVAKVGKFDSAVASGHRIEPDVIVKQHEIRCNGFMTTVHDGDVAGGPFQKIVKSLPVDVKPGGGDQVIKIGIVFHHMIPAFQKLKHSFPAEIRSGL